MHNTLAVFRPFINAKTSMIESLELLIVRDLNISTDNKLFLWFN